MTELSQGIVAQPGDHLIFATGPDVTALDLEDAREKLSARFPHNTVTVVNAAQVAAVQKQSLEDAATVGQLRAEVDELRKWIRESFAETCREFHDRWLEAEPYSTESTVTQALTDAFELLDRELER